MKTLLILASLGCLLIGLAGCSVDSDPGVSVIIDGKRELSPNRLMMALSPVYPAPASSSISFMCELSVSQQLTVTLYTMDWEKVVTILDQYLVGGFHTNEYRVAHLPSGTYYLVARTSQSTQIAKVMIVH